MTAVGALIGYAAGKALRYVYTKATKTIAALYAKGGKFARTLNKAIAKTISKLTGASLKTAKGNGYVLKLRKYTLRIMTSSRNRVNYLRLSLEGKGTLNILGQLSDRRAETHIPITLNNVLKVINLLLKGGIILKVDEALQTIWGSVVTRCNLDVLRGQLELTTSRQLEQTHSIIVTGISSCFSLQEDGQHFNCGIGKYYFEDVIFEHSRVKTSGDKWFKQFNLHYNLAIDLFYTTIVLNATAISIDGTVYELN